MCSSELSPFVSRKRGTSKHSFLQVSEKKIHLVYPELDWNVGMASSTPQWTPIWTVGLNFFWSFVSCLFSSREYFHTECFKPFFHRRRTGIFAQPSIFPPSETFLFESRILFRYLCWRPVFEVSSVRIFLDLVWVASPLSEKYFHLFYDLQCQ